MASRPDRHSGMLVAQSQAGVAHLFSHAGMLVVLFPGTLACLWYCFQAALDCWWYCFKALLPACVTGSRLLWCCLADMTLDKRSLGLYRLHTGTWFLPVLVDYS